LDSVLPLVTPLEESSEIETFFMMDNALERAPWKWHQRFPWFVRHLPVEIRHHYSGADYRRLRRTDQIHLMCFSSACFRSLFIVRWRMRPGILMDPLQMGCWILRVELWFI
jgi:hypothetical protein